LQCTAKDAVENKSYKQIGGKLKGTNWETLVGGFVEKYCTTSFF